MQTPGWDIVCKLHSQISPFFIALTDKCRFMHTKKPRYFTPVNSTIFFFLALITSLFFSSHMLILDRMDSLNYANTNPATAEYNNDRQLSN